MTDTVTPAVIDAINAEKPIFTAGPASLAWGNVANLRPCFGRGDETYLKSHTRVLEMISGLAQQDTTVAMQGSGTSAIEVMIANFLFGRVLVVDSGFYAKRLHSLSLNRSLRDQFITEVDMVGWQDMSGVSGSYDWVLACYTETSEGVLVPLGELVQLAARTGAKLALDATASIGLEPDHGAADVCAFSSCKGLFGLTGAGFISHSVPAQNEISDMISSLATYAERRTTGPYHAMLSLEPILEAHADHAAAVRACKDDFCARFAEHLMYPPEQQPQLCTALTKPIRSTDPSAVMYAPRETRAASITCHIGEVHLGRAATGAINDKLELAG